MSGRSAGKAACRFPACVASCRDTCASDIAAPLPRARSSNVRSRLPCAGRPARMRSPRRHPLPAAHDRSPAARLPRGAAAASDRSGGVPRRAPIRMKSPLAENQRAVLIEAMLPNVPFDGWSRPALRSAARQAGMPADEALALFPNGAAELVACFSRWADLRMLDRLETAAIEPSRISNRIALAVATRLEILAPWREAVRRALSV